MLILFSHFLRKPLFLGHILVISTLSLSRGGGVPPLKLQFGKGGGVAPTVAVQGHHCL